MCFLICASIFSFFGAIFLFYTFLCICNITNFCGILYSIHIIHIFYHFFFVKKIYFNLKNSAILKLKIISFILINLKNFRETGYEISYSSARWPSGTTKLLECDIGNDLCIEKYRKNAAMIQIFYEEFNHETLIESSAYGVKNFFFLY